MTTRALQRPTLVLNRNWQPVNVATVARALVLLWNESARVVDPADYQTYTWEDWSRLRPRDGERFIQAVRFRLRVPEVVTLTGYDRLPQAAVTFIRDVILPGDMKDLMNKVTEAKKAAEANLIARREETAAMRSQANTAKLLEDSPTLRGRRRITCRFGKGTVPFSLRENRDSPQVVLRPALMRLRELEVLEKVASTGKLSVVLGEKGLAERVVNLL